MSTEDPFLCLACPPFFALYVPPPPPQGMHHPIGTEQL